MEYGEVILLKTQYGQDCIGQPVDVEVDKKKIPCTVSSVTRSEWTVAQQAGYNAEIVLNIFTAAYENEKYAIFHGVKYYIYRVYRNGDETELYLGLKIGM